LLVVVLGSYFIVMGLTEREFKRRGGHELRMSKRNARLMCLGVGVFFICVAILRL
jgi:hypothetical protein